MHSIQRVCSTIIKECTVHKITTLECTVKNRNHVNLVFSVPICPKWKGQLSIYEKRLQVSEFMLGEKMFSYGLHCDSIMLSLDSMNLGMLFETSFESSDRVTCTILGSIHTIDVIVTLILRWIVFRRLPVSL